VNRSVCILGPTRPRMQGVEFRVYCLGFRARVEGLGLRELVRLRFYFTFYFSIFGFRLYFEVLIFRFQFFGRKRVARERTPF